MVSLGNSVVEIIINAKDRFSSVFRKAELSLKSFQKSALAFAAIGGTIAFGLKKALDTSIAFESAFTGVRKTVEATEAEFADLENRFKSISKETGTTFVELSKIGELAGQLGIEGVDNLEKFTKTIADITVTTNLTAENAATNFARIANIMQEPIANINNMGSSVVALGNNFATTEAEIVTFAKRISGAGKIVGLSTQEVFAIGTALSSVGVEAEAGGSAVQKALLEIDKAVLEGGDNLNTFAQTAGITSDEFKKLWEQDAAAAFTQFVEGLAKQGNRAALTLEDVKLGGIRTTRALLSLANGGDVLSRAIITSNSAWDENTALINEAELRYATMERQIAKVNASFAIMGDEIGDILAPLIRDFLIPALEGLISFWDSLSPTMKELIVIFALATAGVFLLAGAIALLTLVSLPWLLILFAIAAGITAIILLIKNWNLFILGLTKIFLKSAGAMEKGWQLFKDGFIIAFEVMRNVAISIWNFIVGFVEGQINTLINAINFLIKGLNKIPNVDIPLIPTIDFSAIKGELTDIRNFRAELGIERDIRALQFEAATQQIFDRIAVDKGFTPTGNNMTINIEGSVVSENELTDLIDTTLSNNMEGKIK